MMKVSAKRLAYLFTGILIFALTACVRQFSQVPYTGIGTTQETSIPTSDLPQSTETPLATEIPTDHPGTTDTPVDLTGTSWTLVSFEEAGTETPAVFGSDVTLEFEGDGQSAGSAGCNSFGSQYTLQGSQLSFSQIIRTEMACTSPGVMEQEQRYFQALQSAGEFELNGDQLVIHYDNGSGALNFTRTTTQPTETPASDLLCSLTGTAPQAGWTLCRSLEYGFEVQYPDSAKLGDQTATTARIELPFTSGTNLTEKYLQIAAQENTTTCSSPQAAGYAAGTIPRQPVQLDGQEFIKESGQDAGAGNIYIWEAYSTSRGDLCISLTFVLHSFQPELKPTPPPEYDQAAESQIFTQIAATFAWLNPAATPTATPTPTSAPPTPTAQPTSAAETIRFASGATSAMVSGHLQASGSDLYVLRALGGQSMSLDLSFSKGKAILVVWGANGTVLMTDRSGASHFQGTLPSSQRYYIQVKGRPDGQTDYQLKVKIPPLAAQPTPTAETIRFASGATSARVSGHLQASGSDLYVLRALGGQSMTLDLSFSKGKAILVVWGADGTVLMSDHADASHFQGTLPSSQRYYIQVKGRPDGQTDYQLKVKIPPLAAQPTPTAETIHFASGATSARVSGHLPASGSDLYVLRAFGGQSMTLDLSFSKGKAILVVWGADGTVLMTVHAEASHFQGTLPSSQRYYIQVKGRPDGQTDYKLKVTIPPL